LHDTRRGWRRRHAIGPEGGTAGVSNLVNRFHSASRTDVDAATAEAMEQGDAACTTPRLKAPG